MSDRLVKIATFWYVAEADVVRAKLLMEGIPATLWGATVLRWLWPVANADLGVKVVVRESDVERALAVLAEGKPGGPEERIPSAWERLAEQEETQPLARGTRSCGHCTAIVPAGWEACWACGSLDDGTEFPWGSPDEAAAEPPSPHGDVFDRTDLIDQIGFAVLTMTTILIAFRLSLPAMLFWPPSVLILLALGRRGPKRDEPHEWQTEPEDAQPAAAAPAEDPFADPFPGDPGARWAWLAAGLGLFWFLPLLVYAAWLLWKLEPDKDRLSRRGLRRYRAALAMIVLAVLFWAAIVLTETGWMLLTT